MSATRIAIVGLGMASGPHALSLIDLAGKVEVAYAYSPSAARREKFAAEYPFPLAGDIDTIFDDPSVDAVLLLTPPNTHLELVERCAAAGKHVLLEKPLEITLDRARAVVARCREAGVTLGCVFQHRFKESAERLTKFLGDNRLGALVSASAEIRNWRPQSYYDVPGRGTYARDGGGVLLTQAIHTLDVLVSLTGLPDEVTAFAATSPIHRMEAEDIVGAALRFSSGAIGTVGATTCAYPGFADRIDIIGELGTASIVGSTLAVAFQEGTEERIVGDSGAGGGGADPMAFAHDQHRALIADYVEALRTGGEPRANGREALKVHILIDAMMRSAANRRPVIVTGSA